MDRRRFRPWNQNIKKDLWIEEGLDHGIRYKAVQQVEREISCRN